MSKYIAVVLSDIHYDLNTLELADNATQIAIAKANTLNIPLIIAGDLHNSKANMRAECVNAMLKTFKKIKQKCIVIRGNHDSLNEKVKEHALNFLPDSIEIVAGHTRIFNNLYLIPYHHDLKELRFELKQIPKGSTIIMHQGLQGSNSGEYYQDKSALTFDDVKDFRVISGHYHTRQDIKTGRPQKGAVGLFSYIGNPYTLNFAEATDPEKGFQVLMDDGTLEFIPTNLRKHIVIDIDLSSAYQPQTAYSYGDIVKFKIKGTREQLSKVNSSQFKGKIELIPTDEIKKIETKFTNQNDILDELISKNESSDRLKRLWRSLCE